jgi:hypothetical protein
MKYKIKKPYIEIINYPKKKEYKAGDVIEINNYIKMTKLAIYGFIDRKPIEEKKRGRPSKIERATIPQPEEKAVIL